MSWLCEFEIDNMYMRKGGESPCISMKLIKICWLLEPMLHLIFARSLLSILRIHIKYAAEYSHLEKKMICILRWHPPPFPSHQSPINQGYIRAYTCNLQTNMTFFLRTWWNIFNNNAPLVDRSIVSGVWSKLKVGGLNPPKYFTFHISYSEQ